MSKDNKPFHMREIDEPVVPQDTRDESLPQDASFRHVDLAGIQNDPDIDYAEFKSFGKGLVSTATITEDGRISINVDLKNKLPDLPPSYARDVQEFAVDKTEWSRFPKLNIVIMIVGSRGDVQPYLALGKRLLKDGHRVRIATHETFRSFVAESGEGIEFFAIGGNPQDLMSYMVKNPGLIPGMDSLTNGDITRKRAMLTEMMTGCWLSCHSPCPNTGRTFAADAIISNPPAFAHIHCAEALGIPLLMSFTMPWSPTTGFPHPLVNVKQSNAENGLTNYLSYALAELLTWQGTGDIVNKLRTKSLGLAPLSLRSGPGILDKLKVPWTYCMSPGLVPKPKDWKNHIDVVGFYFLELGTNYQPPADLANFLNAGETPIYIGFGSVVVEDSAAMTKTIFDATAKAGVRALVSAGWGGLGGVSVPSHIFILGNIPHDWLFSNGRVSAVVHHGGAGTTSAGLSHGLPTVVVPFFGDQGFWGSMIHKAGAGPAPIPHKKLGVDNLCEAIKFAVGPQAKTAAQRMSEQIRNDNGVEKGAESFYKHLPLMNMRCDLDPSRVAVWWSTEHCLKLSAFAAQTLDNAKELALDELDPHRSKEYDSQKIITDPVTGGAAAIFWTVTHYYASIAEIFYSPVEGVINTTAAIPKGVVQIVHGIHQGFANAPKLYGSDVRKAGKVTDFSSGLKEAGKGLFYGYYDGITGLVREPMAGAKKDGFVGFVKGAGRSFINATMRPAAGIVGVVAHPFTGAWKSVQSALGQEQQQQQLQTRLSDGRDDYHSASPAQRGDVLRKFQEMKGHTKERQKRYAEMAEKAMDQEVKDAEVEKGSRKEHAQSKPDSVGMSSKGSFEQSTRSPPPLPTRPSTDQVESEDARFERDLEMAKQLSLAEQRGYERGMSERLG